MRLKITVHRVLLITMGLLFMSIAYVKTGSLYDFATIGIVLAVYWLGGQIDALRADAEELEADAKKLKVDALLAIDSDSTAANINVLLDRAIIELINASRLIAEIGCGEGDAPLGLAGSDPDEKVKELELLAIALHSAKEGKYISDALKETLSETRDRAMHFVVKAPAPYAQQFAGLAQDLDALVKGVVKFNFEAKEAA